MLTEPEFRGFLLKLMSLARELDPRERVFLMDLLARANANEPLTFTERSPELDVCARLAWAAWRAAEADSTWIAPNPQPAH